MKCSSRPGRIESHRACRRTSPTEQHAAWAKVRAAGLERSLKASILLAVSDPSNSEETAPLAAGQPAASPEGNRLNPDQWVDAHADYLFRYALIRVRDRAAAEDLVQETLLAGYQSRERYDGRTPERAWLTGILRHKLGDHFRRQNREPSMRRDDALPRELEDRFDDLGIWRREPSGGPEDWGEDAVSLIQRQEFMAALRDCLAGLPPRCADAFVLREMDSEPSGRIQELLGISASNFWVLLHRARMQLRLCLENNWLKT